MIKRILALGLLVSSIAVMDAEASRSRLMVAGPGDGAIGLLDANGNGGSLYIDHPYNMFYNPSYVNNYGSWATVEKSAGTPGNKPEGGFTTSFANFNFGFFFNRNAGNSGGGYNTSLTNGLNYRPVDILLGADMGGMKWGLGMHIGGFKAGTVSDSDFKMNFGAQISSFDPYVGFTVGGNGTVGGVANQSVKDFNFGVRYHWGEWTPYLAYSALRAANTTFSRAFGVGLGRTTSMNDQIKMSYNLGYFRQAAFLRSVIPLNFMVEGNVSSWFSLRGGVEFRFLDRSSGNSNADSTLGRIGASVHNDNIWFDWALGNNGGATGAAGAQDSPDFAFDNGLFTAASVTYKW